jgi:hypothetical protein
MVSTIINYPTVTQRVYRIVRDDEDAILLNMNEVDTPPPARQHGIIFARRITLESHLPHQRTGYQVRPAARRSPVNSFIL